MAKQKHIGRRAFSWAFVVMVLLTGVALASKAGAHRAYVQSGPDPLGSGFYARCIPSGDRGRAGRTQIYEVRGEGDQKREAYDWFAPGGLVLGWSPIKGKVAVLSLMYEGPAENWKTQEAIRFSLGGERLASYTNGELMEMGALLAADSANGLYAGFRVIGCEQIPNTNEYDFVIGIAPTKRCDSTSPPVNSGKRKNEVRAMRTTTGARLASSRRSRAISRARAASWPRRCRGTRRSSSARSRRFRSRSRPCARWPRRRASASR